MRVKDVKIGTEVVFKNRIVIVLAKHQGRITRSRQLQNGEVFTGYNRMPSTFKLSNGCLVEAKYLLNL